MHEPATLRHDDPEAALPHQIELPEAWGLKLPDPLPFECVLPAGVAVPSDKLVELHWWACLMVQLNAILALPALTEKARYAVDTAQRKSMTALRERFGLPIFGAVTWAASETKKRMPAYTYANELGYWTMGMQASFGLLCVQAAALGVNSIPAREAEEIHDWLSSAFRETLGDEGAFNLFRGLCTGTVNGTVAEKLEQWKGALEQAAEGLPDGVPGVEEALDVSAVEEPSVGAVLDDVALSQAEMLANLGLRWDGQPCPANPDVTILEAVAEPKNPESIS